MNRLLSCLIAASAIHAPPRTMSDVIGRQTETRNAQVRVPMSVIRSS